MSMVSMTSNAVDSLSALLSSSISACETYRKAIRRIERNGDRRAVALRAILWDHADQADQLRREVLRLGRVSESSPNVWGVWTKAPEGPDTLVGDATAMKALKEGEQHALDLSLAALPELEGSALRLVRDTIRPSLAQHIGLLDSILAAAA